MSLAACILSLSMEFFIQCSKVGFLSKEYQMSGYIDSICTVRLYKCCLLIVNLIFILKQIFSCLCCEFSFLLFISKWHTIQALVVIPDHASAWSNFYLYLCCLSDVFNTIWDFFFVLWNSVRRLALQGISRYKEGSCNLSPTPVLSTLFTCDLCISKIACTIAFVYHFHNPSGFYPLVTVFLFSLVFKIACLYECLCYEDVYSFVLLHSCFVQINSSVVNRNITVIEYSVIKYLMT